MPKGETKDLLLFIAHKAHCVATLNGCHRDAGHQGHDCTLSLLWECFWWPGMVNQMQQSIKSCAHCLQHEGNLPNEPLHQIVATVPMDLLHVDFTIIQMTLELNRLPKVANVLVFLNHFTKHIMAYVTPNKTAKSDGPTWTVMHPMPQLTSPHCIRNWCSLVCRCLPSTGQMYPPHPS